MDERLEEGSVLELETGMDLESFIEGTVIIIKGVNSLIYRKDDESVGVYVREKESGDILAINMKPIPKINLQSMEILYVDRICHNDSIYERVNKRLLEKRL